VGGWVITGTGAVVNSTPSTFWGRSTSPTVPTPGVAAVPLRRPARTRPRGRTGPPLLNTAAPGLPRCPRGTTCLSGNLAQMSNTNSSVIDLSDASSSPRSEPLWQVFPPGERGVRTARQRPHPQPLIGLFVCLETDRLRETLLCPGCTRRRVIAHVNRARISA